MDVVYKRLNDVGLGEFCLRLHAYNSKRKQVVEDLKRRLDKTRKRSPEEFDQNVIELKRNRNKLNAYVNDVNKNFGSTGLTIQEIFGLLSITNNIVKMVCIFLKNYTFQIVKIYLKFK